MPNPENLIPLKKGGYDPRRGKGRPKKLPQIETILAKVLGEQKDDIDAITAILTSMRNEAIAGKGMVKLEAARILLDRAYGKVKDNVEHSGEMKIEIVRVVRNANDTTDSSA